MEKLPLKRLYQITWPIFIETLLFMLIGSADVLMLSRYNDFAVGAVGVVNQIISMLNVVFSVITAGTSIICAQFIGAKAPRQTIQRIISVSLLLNMVFGFLFSLVAVFFADPLLGFMNIAGDLYDFAKVYLTIVGGTIFLQAFNGTCTAVLHSYGRTRICMIVTLIMNAYNILFNYLLIFGVGPFPALGVLGAAIATATSKILGALILGYILVRDLMAGFSLKVLRPFPWGDVKKLLTLGLPAAMEGISYSSSTTVITIILTSIGTIAVTTYSYLTNITMFVQVFSMSVGSGAAILIGQYIGENKTELVHRLGHATLASAFVVNVCLSLLLLLLRKPIFGIFTSNVEILALGLPLFAFDILNEIGRSANHTMISALRATGDVRYPAVISIVCMWFFGVGVSYALAIWCEMGIYGVWLGMAMDECTRGFLAWLRWYKKGWLGKALV